MSRLQPPAQRPAAGWRAATASGSGAAKLADVARTAGVSTATVSRALNSPDMVSQRTRARVERAVHVHQYIPHAGARMLASQRSRTVGALVPSLSNTISAETIDRFQTRLERDGYSLLVSSYEFDEQRLEAQARTMIERGVEAALIVATTPNMALNARFLQRRIPVIVTYPHRSRRDAPFVAYDHNAAARLVLDHLLQGGHRDIGLAVSRLDASARLRDRVETVRNELARRGIELRDDRLVEMPGSDLGQGREALRRFHASGLPTAIMASDDVLAAGLILECAQSGIRIPQDVSIAGYGDMPLAAHLTPDLTTVRTPKAEIGRLAAETLLGALVDGVAPKSTLLDVEFIERSSTGTPRIGPLSGQGGCDAPR